MRINGYCVECASDLASLVEQVSVLVKAGWVPQGGVAFSSDTTTYTNERKGYEESDTDEVFLQAMVLPLD